MKFKALVLAVLALTAVGAQISATQINPSSEVQKCGCCGCCC